MCINETRIIHSKASWGNVSYVELSNNCLDPAAQFRFRDNGAMLNLKVNGCLTALYKYIAGHIFDIFLIYIDGIHIDTSACSQTRSITQTSWGGLSIQYRAYHHITTQTWCAVSKSDSRIKAQGADPYIGLTTNCNDAINKRFSFGKFLGPSSSIFTCV